MIIQKNVLKIVVIVALVVFSHGCVGSFDSETINDSGTMNEYYEYIWISTIMILKNIMLLLMIGL